MSNQAILCVDDEAIILLALKQELQNNFGERFIYETAMNAEQALEIIATLITEGVNVILIISDWLMPGMRGDVFLEMVYADHPGTSFIMITGHADQEALKRVQEIPGVKGVMKKPWNTAELRKTITDIIEGKK